MASPETGAIEISCLVDIEETADSFHAHAIPQDIDIRPGDVVMVHDAPTGIAFGDRFACPSPRDRDPRGLAETALD